MAVPLKNIVEPATALEPLLGLLMTTMGALFGSGLIVRLMDVVPVMPPESVARAVMMCVPTAKSLRLIGEPVPSTPCMFEVQTIDEVNVPSCESTALPENITVEPDVLLDPLVGAEMVTVGTVFSIGGVTINVIDAVPVRLPGSVARAVMVCVPMASVVVVNDDPVPICDGF